MSPFETASIVTTPVAPVPEGGAAIFKSCVLLVLELRRPGFRRSVKSSDTRYADSLAAGVIHVGKDIIESPELRAIERAHGELRRFIQDQCLPSRFKTGTYLLPIAALEKVDGHIQSEAQRVAELVEVFLTAYPQRQAEGLKKLADAGLANEGEYPDVEKVRESFDIRTAYVAYDTPATLKTIRRDIFEREREKAAASWSHAVDEGRALLLGTFQDLVGSMADRLTATEDGKPRVFRNSLVTNMTEFLDSFTAKDTITNFPELAAVVSDMRGLLNGVSAEDLRKDDAIRANVTENVARIKDHLAGMVIDKPARAFSFTPES